MRRPKPISDESYLGYLLRLADINGYDTSKWILNKSDLKTNANLACVLLTHQKPNYERLATLSGLTVKQLSALTYQAAGQRHVKVFGYQVRPFLLRPQRPRICVACIVNHRIAASSGISLWLRACPIHRVMLLERCPKCKRQITWFRSRVNYCPCGADWRDGKTTDLPEYECVVSRLIYEAFGLVARPKKRPR